MNWFEAIVLGIVQGLTEFLPISSSGHLLVVPQLFGWGDPGASFTAVIQLGTMAAVLAFFWRDIVRITSAWARSLWTPQLRGTLDARIGWYLIIGTIPIVIAGVVFSDQIKTVARDVRLAAAMMIVFGLLLYAADRWGPRRRVLADLTMRDGFLYGVAQMFALIPGVSRSGATITAGRALGYQRETAARFSFLLSIPAVVLSGLYEALDIGKDGAPAWGPTILATIISFVVGYASIAWLLRWLMSHSVLIFTVYRVLAGAAILALVSAGVVSTSGAAPAPTATPNGVASLPADQILAKATDAAVGQSAVRLSGSITSDNQPGSLDVTLTKADAASGAITTKGNTVSFVATKDAVWLAGTTGFWKEFGGAAVAKQVGARWVKAPATNAAFSSFASMSNYSLMIKNALTSTGKATVGTPGTISGQLAIPWWRTKERARCGSQPLGSRCRCS